MRFVLAILSTLIILIISGCSPDKPVDPGDPDLLSARFIYAGQADATLLTTPSGKNLLFDAANGMGADDYLLPLLDSLGIDTLHMAFASHMHGDHIGGFDDLLAEKTLDGFCYDHGMSYYTADYDNYISAVGDNRRTISAGDTIYCGEMQIVCVVSGANGMTTRGENDNSVAVIVTYRGFDIWLGGDLPGYDGMDEIDVESYVASRVHRVECYQADHHGSASSSNDSLLTALAPDFSVISCGIDNPYGLPHDEALDRMSMRGDVYRTDLDGTITVEIIDSTDYQIYTGY